MPCVRFGNAIVTLGGPTYVIEVNGKDVYFEMHDYCGPMPCRKNGNDLHLGPRHKFWDAVTCWSKQGRRVVDGRAIWDRPPTTRFIRIGKRTLVSEAIAIERGLTGEAVDVPDY